MLGQKLITRAPDKMIAYYDNLIILAFRNFILYVNVKEQKFDDEHDKKEWNEVTRVEVKEADFDYLDLDH